MRRRYGYTLAVLAGGGAGILSYIGVQPVVDSGVTALTVGLNVVIWTAAVGLYLFVYEQLAWPDGRPTWEQQRASMKMGGLGGFVSAVGFTGTMALLTSVLSFRFAAVVGVFVFGVVVASMSVGMIATLYRFETVDGTELPTDGAGATD